MSERLRGRCHCGGVSTDLQLKMIGRGLVQEAVPLYTGHVPQITAPEALVQALIRAASPGLD